jgi:hypothetical protein
MANFGYTSDGATALTLSADSLIAYKATAPENGTITAIWVRARRALAASCPFRTGLYDSASSPALINSTGAEVVVSTPTPTWHQSILGTPYSMTSGEVLNLAVFYEGNGTEQLTIYRDAINVGALAKTSGNTYPSWPNPAGTGTTTSSYSIYAEYTPSSGTTHVSTGAIVGPGSAVTGAASRVGNHASTSAIAGPGSVVTGSAARIGLTTHASTGVIVGPGSAIAGSSARLRAHASTGALSGTGSILGGVSARLALHTSTGSIAGAGAVVAGLAHLGDITDAPSSVYVLGWMSDYNVLSGSIDGSDTFIKGEI